MFELSPALGSGEREGPNPRASNDGITIVVYANCKRRSARYAIGRWQKLIMQFAIDNPCATFYIPYVWNALHYAFFVATDHRRTAYQWNPLMKENSLKYSLGR